MLRNAGRESLLRQDLSARVPPLRLGFASTPLPHFVRERIGAKACGRPIRSPACGGEVSSEARRRGGPDRHIRLPDQGQSGTSLIATKYSPAGPTEFP